MDWLVRILRALHRRQEPSREGQPIDLGEGLESLKKLPLTAAQAAAERLLIRFVGDRRLLLITENLGETFDDVRGMGRKGQQRFRDLVQKNPFWTIVASSQALFEDIQTREAPFYGFFKVKHLEVFTFEQALELLGNLAQLEDRGELRRFFQTEVGRGRVRAVHQLTGGNPRLLVIFYQFIDQESIDELAPPFLEMVDTLTSYYQEKMQALSSTQQKIVEFLCERRSAVGVKEIAQSCFISSQTASSQLKRLGERRYVVAHKAGRQSLYELREPLFRICFEVKENMGYPIRLFVDFLGTFYSFEELRRYIDSDPEVMKTPAVRLAEINAWLLFSFDEVGLISLVEAQKETVDRTLQQGLFVQAISGALFDVLRSHESVGLERLKFVCRNVLPLLANVNRLRVVSRLFDAGVAYLASQEQSVLMELPREERRCLVEILEQPKPEWIVPSFSIEPPLVESMLQALYLPTHEAA